MDVCTYLQSTLHTYSGVTGVREGWKGADRPGWYTPGGDTRPKINFFCGWIYKEHQINDVEDGSGEETTAKKGQSLSEAMTNKKRSSEK